MEGDTQSRQRTECGAADLLPRGRTQLALPGASASPLSALLELGGRRGFAVRLGSVAGWAKKGRKSSEPCSHSCSALPSALPRLPLWSAGTLEQRAHGRTFRARLLMWGQRLANSSLPAPVCEFSAHASWTKHGPDSEGDFSLLPRESNGWASGAI